MSLIRLVLLGVGLGLLTVWVIGAVLSPSGTGVGSVRPPAAATAPAATAAVALLDEEIARLRGRWETGTAPRENVRNPFAFGAEAPASVSPAARQAAEELEEARINRPPPAPRQPLVDFVGVAHDRLEVDPADAGRPPVDEATAIFVAQTGELLLVGIGDPLPGGYRVEAIGETDVTVGHQTDQPWLFELD